jgi:hypothetical protein
MRQIYLLLAMALSTNAFAQSRTVNQQKYLGGHFNVQRIKYKDANNQILRKEKFVSKGNETPLLRRTMRIETDGDGRTSRVIDHYDKKGNITSHVER